MADENTNVELDEWERHARSLDAGSYITTDGWVDLPRRLIYLIKALRACRQDFRDVAEQAAEQGRLMIELENRAETCRQQSKAKDAAAEALRFILPMARGYAAAHQVGSNQRIVDEAEGKLAALDKETDDADG